MFLDISSESVFMCLLSTFEIVLTQYVQISNGGLDPADLEHVASKCSYLYKLAYISICTICTTI